MATDKVLSFTFNVVFHNYVKDAENAVFEEECDAVEFLLNADPSVDFLVFVWNDKLYDVKEHNVQFCLEKSLMVILTFFWRIFSVFFGDSHSVSSVYVFWLVLSFLKRNFVFLFFYK